MSLIERMRGKNLGDRQKPHVNGPTAPHISPEVAAFIDSSTRQREELAYFKNHAAQLENDVKLSNERIRSLTAELAEVRQERDYLQKHDTAILASLNNIQVIIDSALASARAQAYAPPGTGQQTQPEMSDHDKKVIEDLAEQLAPGVANA